MKTLQVIINAENFSECMHQLKNEHSEIFKDISQQLAGDNRAKGVIEKDRSNITYLFYDVADEGNRRQK
jgi:hypothetical protein